MTIKVYLVKTNGYNTVLFTDGEKAVVFARVCADGAEIDIHEYDEETERYTCIDKIKETIGDGSDEVRFQTIHIDAEYGFYKTITATTLAEIEDEPTNEMFFITEYEEL